METDAETARSIHYAAQHGDFNMVTNLVNTGISVNAFDDVGYTPLHYAVMNKDTNMVIHLAELGAEINAESRYQGQTPAYLAAEIGSVGCLKLLFRLGASLTLQDNTEEGNMPIHAAVKHRRIYATLWLLKKGVSLNSSNRNGGTPLFCAIEAKDLDLLMILLERGADVNAKYTRNKDVTPLHMAVSHGCLLTIQLLLMNGADMSLRCNIRQETAVHWAARRGNIDMFELMCLFGSILSVETGNEEGNHPVHLAAEEGHLPLVKWLVSKGVSVNCTNRMGFSPLHKAAYFHQLEIASYLLQEGSQVYARTNYPKLNTPLNLAVYSGEIEMVDLLIHYGASVNAADQVFEYTALNHAVMMDNLACLKHLEENGGNKMVGLDGGKGEPLIITAIEYGSNIVARWLLETTSLVNNKFVNYYNPLHCAANFGSREIALLLLKQGADVNCTDYRLWTPLHYAASSGHVDVLGLLISWKADINAECCSGYTALHNAGLENEEFCIQLLALVGGDLNQPSNNEKGVCLIHIAVAFEYENLVRWLLERGVQVDIRSKAGMTGLMFASRLGHYDIAKLLIDKGANVNSKLYSGDNETPLHLACLGGNSALVQLLIENGADVNARIMSYSLPVLHLAVAQNSQSIVELLIRNGADIHAKNSEGFTAVNTAVLSGYDNVKSLHTWRQINVNEYFKFS